MFSMDYMQHYLEGVISSMIDDKRAVVNSLPPDNVACSPLKTSFPTHY